MTQFKTITEEELLCEAMRSILSGMAAELDRLNVYPKNPTPKCRYQKLEAQYNEIGAALSGLGRIAPNENMLQASNTALR